MICSNCGKDIPMRGRVCPYCWADKSNDQADQGMFVLFGLLGMVGVGLVAWLVGGGLIGVVVGGVLGGIICGFVGLAVASAMTGRG
jgi:hypothetical protein